MLVGNDVLYLAQNDSTHHSGYYPSPRNVLKKNKSTIRNKTYNLTFYQQCFFSWINISDYRTSLFLKYTVTEVMSPFYPYPENTRKSFHSCHHILNSDTRLRQTLPTDASPQTHDRKQSYFSTSTLNSDRSSCSIPHHEVIAMTCIPWSPTRKGHNHTLFYSRYKNYVPKRMILPSYHYMPTLKASRNSTRS